MGFDTDVDFLVACSECGIVRDRSGGRSPCPVCGSDRHDTVDA